MKKFSQERSAIWNEAVLCAKDTMEHAKGWIDQEFGKGYAKKHPEVVAAFISATMTAYAGSVIAAAIQESPSSE